MDQQAYEYKQEKYTHVYEPKTSCVSQIKLHFEISSSWYFKNT